MTRDAGPEIPLERLLPLIEETLEELGAARDRTGPVQEDTALDRDLGLDSLSKVELLTQVCRELEIELPERVLAGIETPRDLQVASGGARPAGPREARGPVEPIQPRRAPEEQEPAEAETLLDVLAWHETLHPERTCLWMHSEPEEPEEISYGQLIAASRRIAAGLLVRGLEPGRPVGIMLPTSPAFLHCLHGVLMAGGVPMPLAPPARLDRIEDHLERQASILSSSRAQFLVVPEEAASLNLMLRVAHPDLEEVFVPSALDQEGETPPPIRVEPGDLALLQYTSGSTGDPKGVELRHSDLLANVRAFMHDMRAGGEDVFVSWLPLYHDMGLIGAVFGPLYTSIPLALMDPLHFLTRPVRWLRAVHRYRGSLSAAPNFAYDLCVTRIEDEELEGLDLSSWRRTINGAEPVSPQTLERFQARFGPLGFRASAMGPAFGLAECGLALCFNPIDRAPVVDSVDRVALSAHGKAAPAKDGAADALRFVSCGQPLPGYEVRVVDGLGMEVAQRREGRIQFRGPSATRGYYRNPAATRALFDGDWLRTGDLGYIAGGELYVTGREKDVIIRAGRNFHPQELEEAAGEIPGVRTGRVAAFGQPDPESGTERLVVAAETRERAPEARDEIRTRLRALSQELLGLPADEILLLTPGTILKTSSGKVRRAAMRELHRSGSLEAGPPSLPGQLLRLLRHGLVPGARSTFRLIREYAWALWFWLVLALFAVPHWLAMALLPGLRLRWRITHLGCRLLWFLMGVPRSVHGAEHLPRGEPFVLVANHSCYLDPLFLIALLPEPVVFVAKGELERSFLARVLFRSLEVQFVERNDPERAVADAHRLEELAGSGRSIAFFPEGTFERMPGLMPFRMGAFKTAAGNGLPVVPVALTGSRCLLRGDQWIARRVPVTVTIGLPLSSEGTDYAAAQQLRDAAREFILAHAGEPDLIRPRA